MPQRSQWIAGLDWDLLRSNDMTNFTRTHRASAKPPNADPPDAIASFADPFIAAQRAQWEAFLEAFLAWQQSLAAFNKDLWEQWAVRYAGGLPIDS